MANVKNKLKGFGRYVWELFKSSLIPTLMYCCAGYVIMMVTTNGVEEGVKWTGGTIAWSVICLVAMMVYHCFYSFTTGGNQYEMLVTGNVRRSTMDEFGNGYKISSHKTAKEYRPWKGFVIGGFVSLLPTIFGIILGCNQAAIDSGTHGKALGVVVFIAFFLSGWSIIPFYCINAVGGSVSYFLTLLIGFIPILISGGLYIAGAYARRNKAIRKQILADKMAAEEAARQENKKVNYGALPGTKPKKRK